MYLVPRLLYPLPHPRRRFPLLSRLLPLEHSIIGWLITLRINVVILDVVLPLIPKPPRAPPLTSPRRVRAFLSVLIEVTSHHRSGNSLTSCLRAQRAAATGRPTPSSARSVCFGSDYQTNTPLSCSRAPLFPSYC